MVVNLFGLRGGIIFGQWVPKHFGSEVAKAFWGGGVIKTVLLPHSKNVPLLLLLHHISMSFVSAVSAFMHLFILLVPLFSQR